LLVPSSPRFDLYRDAYGVGHAYAGSVADAFFAQGWVHAADRLRQMDRDRQRARGRWAAVAGPTALPFDVFARRLDLEYAARADLAVLAPATLAMLDAYAAGVNDYIGGHESVAGTPPWTPVDSLLVHRVRHVLMGSARSKLWRAVVEDVVGPTGLAGFARETADEFAIVDGGSNNWVIAGSRTRSGLPLLAGDPHRELEVPNVYTQSHVACPEFDAIGIGFAGVPGFGHFGHGRRVAWSITHGMLDDQDVFRERFDGDGRFEFDGEQVEPRRRIERIEVAGADPVDVEIVMTTHGPVIAGPTGGDAAGGDALALRWTATCEPNAGFDCFVPMLRADSVPELFEAMRAWVEPANNLLAADVDGAIGFLFRGRVPVRPLANGDLPVAGWTSANDWRGWVPFEELPRSVNPAAGRLVTANHRVAPPGYPHYLSRDFAAPNRARRIATRLDALEGATARDMVGVLNDTVSLPGQRMVERLKAEPAPTGPPGAVHAAICGWDGDVSVDSPGALAYEVLRRELGFLLLERSGLAAAGDHPYIALLPGIDQFSLTWRFVAHLLQADDTSLLADGTWSAALAEGLDRAAAWIVTNVGADASAWRWGAIHRTRLGFEVPGDADTVRVAAYVPTTGFDATHASVARYVFDVADWDRSRWVLPLGVEGDRDAPHATDQQPHWVAGALVPMLYTRDAIEGAAAGVKLGLGPEFAPWLRELAANATSLPLALPDDATARQWLVDLSVPADDIAAVLDARPRTEEARWIVEHECGALVDGLGTPSGLAWPPLPDTVDEATQLLHVWAFLAALPAVREWHAARGIPDDVSRATLADLGDNMAINRRTYGRTGLEVPWWITLHFRGAIYSLGRLQFERTAIADGALGVHIPESGPLTPDACDASIAWAHEFFARHFPDDKPRVATCNSWLLDEQLAEYLPADSNIIRFQRRFTVQPGTTHPANGEILRFVFGVREPDLDTVPQTTTLQRAAVAHLKAGGTWNVSTGYFDW
jgi:penicillin amidase